MTGALIWVAAGLSAVICAVHVFVGGKDTANPVQEAAHIDPTAKYTVLLAWHYTSATLAVIAGLYVATALTGDLTFAACATVLTAIYTVIGLVYPRRVAQSYMVLPQGFAFGIVTIVGTLVLLG